MRLVFMKLSRPGKETVGHEAVGGTARIHAGYDSPTNELDWWDKGGQVVANCRGDSAASHLIHHESGDVGRGEPACTLAVPRFFVVPPCVHVERGDDVGIDFVLGFLGDHLPVAAAQPLAAVSMSLQPGLCGGWLALSADQARISVSGARHAAD